MTDILPPAGWPNVRQLETNEFATGGANGNMNEQAKSLAARSELLKQYAALPYESKTGGYALNERVQLANGDIVRSTIPSNVNNPNENMTGWVKTNAASQIFDESGKNQQEINNIKLREFNVLMFGADPTGTRSSHQAFKNCALAVAANGGGKVVFPMGDYIVGGQIRHVSTESGYNGRTEGYEADDPFYVSGCGTVLLDFQGCNIKFEDGLKYGRWDAETEQPIQGTDVGFVNWNKKASIGRMFALQNNEAVLITGTADLDGNMQNYNLGGLWGDLGRQCSSYGVWLSGNKLQGISGLIKAHHFGLDGLYNGGDHGDGTKWKEGDFGQSGLIAGFESEYNGRQGLSHTGGAATTYISCKFNNTGRGRFASAPSAGVDVEAESGSNRDVLFINCEMINNVGNAYIDATGDSDRIKLINSKLVGTTNYAGWFMQSQLVDCTVVGAYGAGSLKQGKNSRSKKAVFENCIFTDDPTLSPTGQVFTGVFGIATLTNAPMSVLYKNCEWHTYQNSFLLGFTNNHPDADIKIKGGKWVVHEGSTLGGELAQCQFYNTRVSDFEFIDERPLGSDDNIIVAKRPAVVWKNVSFQSASGKFRLNNIPTVVNTSKKRHVINDRTALVDTLEAEGAPNWALRLIKGDYSNEYTQDTLHQTTSKMVMSATFNVIGTEHQWNPFGISDRVINKNPTDSSWVEAICVTAGYTCPDAWAASTSIALNAYRHANGKVYQATVAGITGQTSPSHSSGSASDGTVTWLYIGERAVFRSFGIKGSAVSDNNYTLSPTPTVQELATAISAVQSELRALKNSVKAAGYIL